MNIKNLGFTLALAASAVLSIGSSTAAGIPAPPAKVISPIKAMAIAKKKMGGGKAFNATLEFDEGHWVYGVMVVKNHKISEVEIDPVTGKVGDSESVDPNGEAKETVAALMKMIKSGG